MRGFSQIPRTHSFAQAGAYPALPLFRLSKRRGYTSSRPRKRDRKSAILTSDRDVPSTESEIRLIAGTWTPLPQGLSQLPPPLAAGAKRRLRIRRLAPGRQPARHDQGAVVGEGDAADEGFEIGVEGGGEVGAGGLAVAAAEVGEAVVAVLLAVGVVGLDDAVGVEDQGVAGRQQDLGYLVGGRGEEGDRYAGRGKLLDGDAGAHDEGRVVAGVGVAQDAAVQGDGGDDGGGVLLGRRAAVEEAGELGADLVGRQAVLDRAGGEGFEAGGEQRGRHSLARDVGDHQHALASAANAVSTARTAGARGAARARDHREVVPRDAPGRGV